MKIFLPILSFMISMNPCFSQGIESVENIFNREFKKELIENDLLGVRIVKNTGSTGKFERNNAVAIRSNNYGEIRMGSSIIRHLTSPENLFLICHELGHLVGGSPTLTPDDGTDVEGQADYFASSKCLKRILKYFPIQAIEVEEEVRNKCFNSYGIEKDRMTCEEIAWIAKKTILQLHRLILETTKDAQLKEHFKFIDPVSTIPARPSQYTYNSHPEFSCRYQTLLAGAYCNIDPYTSFSATDELKGACDANSMGGRPGCWYREGSQILNDKY